MSAKYRLVIQNGSDAGKTFLVDQDEMSIGRERSNQVVINDVEVSRKHAVLTIKEGKCILQDHGSTNGTFVNGLRLISPMVLHGGEVIALGENTTLLFEVLQEAVSSLPVEPAPVELPVLEASPVETLPYAPAENEIEVSRVESYAGQIPQAPAQPAKTRRLPVMLVIAIVGFILVCCIAALFIIDATRSWCYLAGWFFNAIDPGACP